MRFENTKYENNLSGGYSVATENYDRTTGKTAVERWIDPNDHSKGLQTNTNILPETNRESFNDLYDSIETSPQNYYKEEIKNGQTVGTWRKAYGLYAKLENELEEYIPYNNTGPNEGSFRYYDALEIFREVTTNPYKVTSTNRATMNQTYYSMKYVGYNVYETEFKQMLAGLRIDQGTRNSLWSYVLETLTRIEGGGIQQYNNFERELRNRLTSITITNGNTRTRLTEENINTIFTYIRETMIKEKDKDYKVFEEEYKNRLREIGISEEEANNVWQYINDTLIKASTTPYPEQDKFVLEDVDGLNDGSVIGYPHLYIRSRDQSRNVDFGIKLRTNADVYLAKDIYKATLLVNGKQQEYYYNKKKSETDGQGAWVINLETGTYEYRSGAENAEQALTAEALQNQNMYPQTSESKERAQNEDYIGESDRGGHTYTREIRKSEYLYDGSDVGTSDDDIKNLQVFITYKIAVKNQTQDVWTSIDEIVDYYDSSQYLSPLDLPGSTIVQNNTYIGDSKGNRIYDLTVKDESRYVSKYGDMNGYYANSNNINGSNDYKAIYLTGMRSIEDSELNGEKHGGETRLMPGEITYCYITFKVQNDPATGKVKIDQNVEELLNGNVEDLVGKRNIAEINGYSTYFHTFGQKDWRKAGVVDLDSNAGSIKPKDLTANGDIRSSENSYENRLEDDTDKASNIKLKINTNKEEERSFSGYTYEDARTEISDGAIIGNGRYNESDHDFENNYDKKINGITLELVELVQEVDAEGFPTGNYEKEYIWDRITYTGKTAWNQNIDNTRYYSGLGEGKVILSGEGIFKVEPEKFGDDNKEGTYKFESLPPGDFFVRFIYGDTTQTVLTNIPENISDNGSYTDSLGNKDEVQEMLNSLTNEQKGKFIGEADNSGILGLQGLNSKSYTGQDYKSTIYQKEIRDKQETEVNQDTYYNGINGYKSTETQNYNRGVEANNKNIETENRDGVQDKGAMYYYNIGESDKDKQYNERTIGAGISDAKDVYSYREDEKRYSLGSVSRLKEGLQTLKNHRAEVLASGTKLVTKAEKAMEEGLESSKEKAMEYQREAIKELMTNTKMVAQTGIINAEVEYNRNKTDVYKGDSQEKEYVQNLSYKLMDLDLGLTERPEAQLQLTKELTNIQIKLANGSILFDATQSVPNLFYGEHREYTEEDYYQSVEKDRQQAYRLRHDIQNKIKGRQEELVQVTMDEELMSGATVRLTYRIRIDNIGEVDYLDKDFYYKGKTSNVNWENVSRTNAINVLDYVTNELNYEINYQNDINDWEIITADIILGTEQDKAYNAEANNSESTYNKNEIQRIKEDNDYINSYYEENLRTYTILIKTEKLSGDLIPRAIETEEEKAEKTYRNSRREVNLILSTLLENTMSDKNLIYNNLAEIIETTNSWGRRMELSKAGDETVPYQSEKKSIDESTIWVRPKDPDADSGQRVQIGVPTGENKNISIIIVGILMSLGIIIVSILGIKKKVLKDK